MGAESMERIVVRDGAEQRSAATGEATTAGAVVTESNGAEARVGEVRTSDGAGAVTASEAGSVAEPGPGRDPERIEASLDELVERARALIVPGERRLLGMAGAPGAGKSTLAARIVAELGEEATLVPMDGYHLSRAVLANLGRTDRKGAPDTFDAAGFVALLGRLQEARETVYVPSYDRDLHEPVAAALAVSPVTPLLIVEGNYLLLDDPEWAPAREFLDAAWYVEIPTGLRTERLVARHEAHGKSPEHAREWVFRSDEANARLIEASAVNADLIVTPVQD
ncbi:pantothenate kinase [Mycetocola sp. BIGb0189]|uniref:nucleoside/nucleotide kinase family protein n=1 Tax=Mycetocola sp. BIGb0189 TaxID=2940604 RepID=UPI00286D6E88|nr:nucleoside/nucleotide kinase family protein [Mycetocola sp. BIGb0189]MCS4275130.1 pantothenate kinase [Mycetocola sp. BIGb0189]